VLNHRAVISASGAMSVRLYRMAQGTIEFPYLASGHVRIGAQMLFRDAQQVNYFGLGNDSSVANRSGYRLQTNDVTSYATLGGRALSLQARAGWLAPVTVSSMRRPAIYPDTLAVFTEASAPGLAEQPSFLHGDVSLTVDVRDYPGHPTAGGFFQVTWSGFADERTGQNSFQRYEAEATQYVPTPSDNWILALHGYAALSDATSGHIVPFYLMPNLGGRNLRGYTDFRFHDRNLQSYSVESMWRVFSHVDAAAFVDAGSVAREIRQLKFTDLKPTYGVGIRLHNQKITIARLDVGHGAEGWHLFFTLNEPFRRSTQSNGWRIIAPFVP